MFNGISCSHFSTWLFCCPTISNTFVFKKASGRQGCDGQTSILSSDFFFKRTILHVWDGTMMRTKTWWNFDFLFFFILFSELFLKEPAWRCGTVMLLNIWWNFEFVIFFILFFRFVFGKKSSLKVWDGDAVEYLGDFRGKEKSAAQRRQSWCYINHPKVDETVWAINHS